MSISWKFSVHKGPKGVGKRWGYQNFGTDDSMFKFTVKFTILQNTKLPRIFFSQEIKLIER